MSTIDIDTSLSRFGFQKFRPGQREAIEALLEFGRLLLVAPTGGGKSLTYQLPASCLPGTTVVVSPLVALMHDQVASLERLGIPCTYLASTLSNLELRKRMAKLANSEFKLVYIAPERLSFPGFRSLLEKTEIPLIAIDEAHCISEWGHDFRPEYLQLGDLLRDFPKAKVLACTATATPVVRDEICSRLGLGADTPQILRGFARPNLALRAKEVNGQKEINSEVDDMLYEAIGKPGDSNGAVIIYAPTRKSAEEMHARLNAKAWKCGCYHAGLASSTREQTLHHFSIQQLDIVVATNAFGMGIDRSDVRCVIHLAPPASIESYYQEVGRAGRDQDLAWGLLLCRSQDMPLRRRLLEAPADGQPPNPLVIEHKWNLYLELMRWIEGGSCRHDAILRYFGDDQETLSGCNRCDVCERLVDSNGQNPEETALIVRKILSGVARVHQRLGLHALVKLLRGQNDDRLNRLGLSKVSTFGVLSDFDSDWLTRLVRRCITAGWVCFTAEQRPTVYLTESGKLVMLGKAPARILLPPHSQKKPNFRTSTVTPGSSPDRKAMANDEPLTPQASLIFEALRKERMRIAEMAGLPPYIVASDRSLRDLARLRPKTLDEMTLAHGIGPNRVERYGRQLLRIVQSSKSTGV